MKDCFLKKHKFTKHDYTVYSYKTTIVLIHVSSYIYTVTFPQWLGCNIFSCR